MPKDLIRYDLLVQNALKGVVRKVLGDVMREGLPGDHHFYISFRTDAPGARVSNALREKYPEEMTIVLQHQFWDLSVGDTGFEVGLSFSGVPEKLVVPYEAITGFFDPSVQFGLKFELKDEGSGITSVEAPKPADAKPDDSKTRVPHGRASEPLETPPSITPARQPARPEAGASDKISSEKADADEAADDGQSGAEVVSLDAFRKKH